MLRLEDLGGIFTLTIAELCLLASVFLWLATIGLAKGWGWRDYDNGNPRSQVFYNSSWKSRALGAHQNGLEALPFFAAAVLLAELRRVDQSLADGLSAAFIVMRLVYVAVYLADKALMRSVIWTAGFLLNIALFLTPLLRR